ncbi:cytochrome P450 monooxygenase sdnE [Echria macrotheca]|uniref:Cytochrome P450 monooxygenase sdnE n=1 Tax=Echria macrotheca TaxID=438768 RepID=A0AAJ0F6R7_9PEZI|nr:cytochrome P450 monooxygenase sdnE [Echria macrotheca]
MDSATGLLWLGLAGLTWTLITAVRRVYFSPISHIPGPKSATLTLWNEFWWDVVKRGTFIWKIREMHAQYGPIIRINPYEVHILDPEFYSDIYVSPKKLDKYAWWTKLAGADGSGFSTVPHDLHRQRRAALNPFFSARSVSQLEPVLRSKIERLSSRLDAIHETQEIVRLDAAFMALTMDIICTYAFASDLRYLDEPDFKLEWKKTIIGAFEGGALGRQFPFMLPLMKMLPIGVVEAMNPGVGYLLRWQGKVRAQVEPILDSEKKKEEGEKRTIFHTLRDSDLPASEKTLQRLCDEGEILVGAGSETTAQTLARMFYYLGTDKNVLGKLRRELDSAVPDVSRIPSWAELQGLPYLGAVIKESLRLSYGVTTRLPRVAHEDIHYKGYVIPAGTPISQTAYFILTHPDVFPEPHVFRPERWLENGKLSTSLDKYLVAFGKGSRQCLGINLAYAELYLTTATLVRRFDWEIYETTLDDVVCKRDFFVAVADLDSKGIRARIVARRS